MRLIDSIGLDYTILWTWFLVLMRISGLLASMPGLGTDQIPASFRTPAAIVIAMTIALSGVSAHVPISYAEGGVMIFCEFILGYVLGLVPALIIAGVTVAGQVASGAMGLGQANMIDPSLGGNVAVLGRIQGMLATLIFLFLNGHHAVIYAASGIAGDIGIGVFRPDMQTADILFDRFRHSFELSASISAPVIVTLLVAQFVLGLVTKFVPQVNIFIISLPLTILVGFYITAYTFSEMSDHVVAAFTDLEEVSARVLAE